MIIEKDGDYALYKVSIREENLLDKMFSKVGIVRDADTYVIQDNNKTRTLILKNKPLGRYDHFVDYVKATLDSDKLTNIHMQSNNKTGQIDIFFTVEK